MKRFWLATERTNFKGEVTELSVYSNPSETYQEAVEKTEKLVGGHTTKILVLEIISCARVTKVKWTQLDR